MNTPTKEDQKKPVSFSQWFLKVIRHFEEKGVEFDRIKSGLVKIQLPGHPAILRACLKIQPDLTIGIGLHI